jgi:hypothetical protein
MIGPAVIAFTGLVAGAVHVFSGPDHLAAVAPLAVDSRRSLWRSGLLWGIGHTGGVLAVGGLALLLRDLLPIEALSAFSERTVGLALVAVGLWGIRRAARLRIHVHAHEHGGSGHTHLHVHDASGHHSPSDGSPDRAHDHVHASFLFGVLHGLAGSSHLFGILPALALPSREASLVYLGGYGAGTVASMTLFSSLMGVLASRIRGHGAQPYRALLYACSTAAILVGGVWLIA